MKKRKRTSIKWFKYIFGNEPLRLKKKVDLARKLLIECINEDKIKKGNSL